MKRIAALAVLALALISACGSGSDKGGGGSSVREPKDPRTVPSATVPATIPSPIPAVDAGQPARRPTQPPDAYVVKAGDTPAGIAQELGVDLAELLRLNQIDDPRNLKVGQQLKVPRIATPSPTPGRPGAAASPARTGTAAAGSPTRTATGAATTQASRTPTAAATPAAGPGGTYTVQSGDTACEIATKLGVPLTALAEANSTTIPELRALRIGQELKVPTTRGAPGC